MTFSCLSSSCQLTAEQIQEFSVPVPRQHKLHIYTDISSSKPCQVETKKNKSYFRCHELPKVSPIHSGRQTQPIFCSLGWFFLCLKSRAPKGNYLYTGTLSVGRTNRAKLHLSPASLLATESWIFSASV